jgi:phosphatidylglycerophosphatase A
MTNTSADSAAASASFQAGNIRHLLAYGFGTGLSPWAPGTVGTLVAVPIYLVLSTLPFWFYAVAVVAMIAVGVWACEAAARDIGADDSPAIVWDEIVGFLVAMMTAPVGWAWVIAGFLLFRAFDIFKPWPIGTVDKRVRGGLGIMLDDIIAGLMTFVVLHFMHLIVVASLRGAGAH